MLKSWGCESTTPTTLYSMNNGCRYYVDRCFSLSDQLPLLWVRIVFVDVCLITAALTVTSCIHVRKFLCVHKAIRPFNFFFRLMSIWSGCTSADMHTSPQFNTLVPKIIALGGNDGGRGWCQWPSTSVPVFYNSTILMYTLSK